MLPDLLNGVIQCVVIKFKNNRKHGNRETIIQFLNPL